MLKYLAKESWLSGRASHSHCEGHRFESYRLHMNSTNSKILFFSIWLFLVLLGPYTIYKSIALGVAINNPVILINVLQRITGLVAFTLIFIQIVLGSLMQKWTEKLGGWVFKFHLIEGAIAYTLILAHPLLFVFLNFKITGVFDPFYVFTQICVICKDSFEYFYTFGRISFWLITLAVLAAKLRTQPWFQIHWRKFHVLNYVAFFFIVAHSFFVGTDVRTAPFSWFYFLAITTVVGIIIYKFIYPFIRRVS